MNGREKLIEPVAHVENGFSGKFAVPRQSGLADVKSLIVFDGKYKNPDVIRGVEAYSHLWLLWDFSLVEDTAFRATVRPPKLGGNTRVGVFATRSPYRPNGIGLSSVRLISVNLSRVTLTVAGADLANGTPIYDVKPYLSYTDSHPDAACGFAGKALEKKLKVDVPERLAPLVTPELSAMLAEDPRPSYQSDPERVYAFEYGGISVRFAVDGEVLRVTEIYENNSNQEEI